MGERESNNRPTSSAPWALDVTSGYPDVFRGVDDHLFGGFSSRDPGIGSRSGGFGDRGSWFSLGSFFSGRRNPTPKWYQWLVAGASGLSLIVILMIVWLR